MLGEFQQYQYGRPQARVNYSQNSDTRQRLTPFIFSATLNPDTNGLVNYPSEYLQTDSIVTENYDRIRFVQQDSLYSFLKSEIDPISTNPIYLLYDAGYKFYPNTTYNGVNLSNVKVTYVMNAPAMLWAYTLDVNNRPVYDPIASIQPLWYDIDKLELVARILKLVGVSLQDGQVEQYANQVTQIGQ